MKNAALSNKEIYKEKLASEFPVTPPSGSLFFPNTFTGQDEKDYLSARSIFFGKKWDEVSFDETYNLKIGRGILFTPLSEQGKEYYIPAFLNYFYDVRNLENESINEYFKSIFRFYESRPKYIKYFEKFTIEQSKLIALFLATIANLSNSEKRRDAELAQKALTNYWGNFLLF